MKRFLNSMPWYPIVMASLTLGLAPFAPPHVYEKLVMLFSGTLVKPIDWGDLIMHGAPWVILILKSSFYLTDRLQAKKSS